MIELNKYIVITTNDRKVFWTIINHEFYKWFNYLVKTYKVDQDYIFYSRGMSIKRKLLVNRLIIILKRIGVDINTVKYITSGLVTIKIRENELIICLRKEPPITLLLHKDSPLTVNLIKFYKYQKNDNSTRARGGY